MLVTLSTTHVPATDLGFLLHKHPDRVHDVALPFGSARVFYPEATDARCTVAVVLEVDPIGVVRKARMTGEGDGGHTQYVNDRAYVASSMFAVALGKVFSSARRGVSKERPELVDEPLPLAVGLPALSSRGGAESVRRFFEPLGWQVEARAVPLDETFPEWGQSRCVSVDLSGTLRLADALNQLYVALPVLDASKHYWIGADEIDKLMRAGAGWLPGHPERDWIARCYLGRRRAYARQAMERLAEADEVEVEAFDNAVVEDPGVVVEDPGVVVEDPGVVVEDPGVVVELPAVAPEVPVAAPEVPVAAPSLAMLRHRAVLDELRAVRAVRVIDLGCGDGALLAELLSDRAFTDILGVDVSIRALEIAARRLHLDDLPERQRARITLAQTGLTYTDTSLKGYDAAVLMEVIEHLDVDRLPALEHAVFGFASPGSVIVTTPNREYNVRYPGLADGTHRHPDHRFEWTRSEFGRWATGVGERHGYDVRLSGVGPMDADLGTPTQMAVFTKGNGTGEPS